MGSSGAGTTLLTSAVPSIPPRRVTTAAHDLRDVTLRSLREQIAVVPQEPILFAASVRENIRYGRLDASDADLAAAAEAANATQFVAKLTSGLDTIVCERGIRLSGGQRQRVAIARAVLRDAPILLLDEATSSLDNESEYLVQQALDRLMRGRTTIVIAHRLSTVERAPHPRARPRRHRRGTRQLLRSAGSARLYERRCARRRRSRSRATRRRGNCRQCRPSRSRPSAGSPCARGRRHRRGR